LEYSTGAFNLLNKFQLRPIAPTDKIKKEHPQRCSFLILFLENDEGFERAAKQVKFQQKDNAACADE